MASNAVERCAPRGYSGHGGTEGLGAARGLLDRQSRMVAASCLLRASRLQLYGYAVAAVYALFLVSVYRAGTWILDARGMPIYTDFACACIAALQAIHGQAASLYDP